MIIGSASSKTAFGLARLLYVNAPNRVSVCGLTARSNVAFVSGLGACHTVLAYDDMDRLAVDVAAVFVDMAGDKALTAAVHARLGDQLRQSIKVGATHWEAAAGGEEFLAGPEPGFFFAPAQITRRDEQWGQGVVMQQALTACVDLARGLRGQIEIAERQGSDAVLDVWTALLDNRMPPDRGMILSL